MSEVAIVGLGLMGLANAKAYQEGGVPITVWRADEADKELDLFGRL